MNTNTDRFFKTLNLTIEAVAKLEIRSERLSLLDKFTAELKSAIEEQKSVRLNFICTHNSRRSHLAQVWAQTMASYFRINEIYCFSGGTEKTAIYPMVIRTLIDDGFNVSVLGGTGNPIYSIKSGPNEFPIIGFSKKYDHCINPNSNFVAVMTCSHADENCPVVSGASKRIALTYTDPKAYDEKDTASKAYRETSHLIASEMYYIFKNI